MDHHWSVLACHSLQSHAVMCWEYLHLRWQWLTADRSSKHAGKRCTSPEDMCLHMTQAKRAVPTNCARQQHEAHLMAKAARACVDHDADGTLLELHGICRFLIIHLLHYLHTPLSPSHHVPMHQHTLQTIPVHWHSIHTVPVHQH